MNSSVFNKIMSLIFDIQDIKNQKDKTVTTPSIELTQKEDELYLLIMTMT